MSIVLVVFPGAPKPTNEAMQAEKELNATIEKRIKGDFSFHFCLQTVIYALVLKFSKSVMIYCKSYQFKLKTSNKHRK